jgi:hypothetical protein
MIDQIVIADYAEAMREGASFPAVVVWFDGTDYWLSDGYHRVHAALTLGLDTIHADVRTGTQQDAQWHSYGVNATHGLRRTNDDKRRAVEAALRHPNAATMSDNIIARHCGVTQPFVGKIRRETVSYNDYKIEESTQRIVTRGNSTYIMNIGRTAEPQITHYAPIDPTPPRHEPVEDEEEKAEWWHRPEEEPAEEVQTDPFLFWSPSEIQRRSDVERGMTVVANIATDKNLIVWAQQTNRYARVDRNSIWGNPFVLNADGNRDEVCDWYAEYFTHRRSLQTQLGTLKGRVLGCWCYPERCHGDHLRDLAEASHDH